MLVVGKLFTQICVRLWLAASRTSVTRLSVCVAAPGHTHVSVGSGSVAAAAPFETLMTPTSSCLTPLPGIVSWTSIEVTAVLRACAEATSSGIAIGASIGPSIGASMPASSSATHWFANGPDSAP